MKGFENMPTEVAQDLIQLVNSMKGIEKTAEVNYSGRSFHYVPLDNILNKVKENPNFAVLQPIGVDETGIDGVKTILIHKSGYVISTDTYPFNVKEGARLQDEGAEITYRKRYSIGALLGMATDDDTDGNDEQAISVTVERKASPKQVEILSKNYTGENLTKLLEMNHVDKVEDIPMAKASELIGKLIKRKDK